MKILTSPFAVAAFAVAANWPALAQPKPETPAAVWRVDWVGDQCQIATGATNELGVALRMTPGNEGATVYLVGTPEQLPAIKGTSGKVTLTPGGVTFPAYVARMEPPGKRVFRLSDLGKDFADRFSKASELHLATDAGAVAAGIKGAGEAMAAMRGCMDEALQEWGIDPKAYASLRQQPEPIDGGRYWSGEDFPEMAMKRDDRGHVVVRAAVDATGRVTDCKVVVSSGSLTLDKTTCRALLQKGKFKPAIGVDGRPTAAFIIYNVNWQLI